MKDCKVYQLSEYKTRKTSDNKQKEPECRCSIHQLVLGAASRGKAFHDKNCEWYNWFQKSGLDTTPADRENYTGFINMFIQPPRKKSFWKRLFGC